MKEALMVFGCTLFGLVVPVVTFRWRKVSLEESLFWIFLGVMASVLSPFYLGIAGFPKHLLILLGITLFFCYGLSNLVAHWWADAGYAIGLGAYSWTLHWFIMKFFPSFHYMKWFILICMSFSAFFIIFSLDFHETHNVKRIKKGKIVIAVMGAVFTVVKFSVILVDAFSS